MSDTSNVPEGAAVFPLIPPELNVHPLLLATLHAFVFIEGSEESVVDPDAAAESVEYLASIKHFRIFVRSGCIIVGI